MQGRPPLVLRHRKVRRQLFLHGRRLGKLGPRGPEPDRVRRLRQLCRRVRRPGDGGPEAGSVGPRSLPTQQGDGGPLQ